MAELPDPVLVFGLGDTEEGGPPCPDCGERIAVLPPPLPGVTDDFDWAARDYDSFRLFMMQELASRFPDRRRWTAADMEVVIVELLAAALDRTSDALDRVQAERFLDSARRPQSVRRLLKLIGFDATQRTDPAKLAHLPPLPVGETETPDERLERYWRLDPQAMKNAREEGPRRIFEQLRMVTLTDHETTLVDHPLVSRAKARLVQTAPWTSILVATVLENDYALDQYLHSGPPPAVGDPPSNVVPALWTALVDYHRLSGLPLAEIDDKLTARKILRTLIERTRMVGSEIFLENAKPAPITFTLSVRAKEGYFRSELKQALEEGFSSGEGGFFEPGRLDFGVDLFASDIIETAMAVEGVAVACLNRFRRLGLYLDAIAAGVIEVTPDEYIQCLNRRGDPGTGTFRILVNEGDIP